MTISIFFFLPFTQRQEDRHEPSECWPVNLLINVLFPTDGKPMNPLALVSVSATQPCTNERYLHTRDSSTGNVETDYEICMSAEVRQS